VPVTRRLSGRLAVVANLPEYALGLALAANAVGDDGLLDLRLFRRPSTFQMLRYFYKVLLRQHEELSDVYVGRIRRMRIDCKVPVPIQSDGDPAGWTPAEISVLPRGLTLFVPDFFVPDPVVQNCFVPKPSDKSNDSR
jgi:diacylglycerol kinase family enzyme